MTTPVQGLRVGELVGVRPPEKLLAAAAPRASGEYRTAAPDLPPAVAATIHATIAGAPLDAVGEASAARRDWVR